MGDSALEFAVLAHLEDSALIGAELARRTGASERSVQEVLDVFVARALVHALPRPPQPTSYSLTVRGIAQLRDRSGATEEQRTREWRKAPLEEPVQRLADVPGQQPVVSFVDPQEIGALEHKLLEAMEHGDLSRIELARRLGVRGPKVQKLLDKLVSETFVARYPQDDLPTEYGLTEAGVGRLKLVRQFQQAPWSTLGQVTAAALTQRRRQPVIRREKDRLRLRLSDAERSACSAALAEQFSIGRLDTEELKRRSDRLYAATTRAELAVVFDGLPMPQLDEPTAPAPAGVPWRWVGFGIAVACSLPFLLIGYGLLTNPRDLDNILFGLFCAGGVLVWNYFAWTWARRGSRV